MKRILFESLLRACFLILIALVPLPFGLVENHWNDRACVLFAIIALLALLTASMRRERFEIPPRLIVAVVASFGFLLLAALQLAPLGETVVSWLSAESVTVWSPASLLSKMLGGDGVAPRVTVDVLLTTAMVVRLITFVSVIIAGATLIRRRGHRYWLVAAIGCSAVSQFIIAFRQWIDPDPASTIWGWRNPAIVDRVSGTFVNPNHFAHYLALAIPICVYAAAAVIERNAVGDRRERLQLFFERGLLPFTAIAVVILACVGGIFLAQSRGTVLALVASIACTGVLSEVHRRRARRQKRLRRRRAQQLFIPAALGIFALLGLAAVARFGAANTVERMLSLDDQSVSLTGRLEGVEASMEIWREFPVLGSGLGTFERLSWMEADRGGFLRHAHNDYLEVLATGGVIGLTVLLMALFLILRDLAVELQRHAIERRSDRADRRYFLLAAFATIVLVMVHALYDFNAYIPANPLTAAAIIGAASAARVKKQGAGETNSLEG